MNSNKIVFYIATGTLTAIMFFPFLYVRKHP